MTGNVNANLSAFYDEDDGFTRNLVTGKKIPLEQLRYWNAARQEAYAGPAEALQRWRETQ